jgi:hypothetical protein
VEDGAPLALGEDLAGPLSIAIIAVKADLEAIRLAAFIRWCKDEMVRQASLDFVGQCNVIAKGGARSLVADCDLLLNASNPKIQAAALERANREAAKVSKALKDLSSHVTTKAKDAIGGYPPVVAALGRPALTAMAVVYDEKDGVLLVAQQIDDVFKGANAMAKFVKKNYTN